MELVCLLLTVFGLIICFGGIYIRKFCSSIMGLVWGAFLSIILIVLTTESIWQIDSEESLVWIVIGAITLAIFSAIYEKACAFLNSFIPTFFIVCVLLLFNILSNEDLEMSAVVMIALIVAFISGFISYKIYDIAFMLETAFTGAFIASLGIYGLTDGANDVGDVVFGAVMDDEVIGYILLGTVVLGIIGFCVQWGRFKTIKEEKNLEDKKDTSTTDGWQCQCGKLNSFEHQFCEECGKQFIEPDFSQKSWNCKCGASNAYEMLFCSECGANRLQQEYSKWICSTCGTENEHDMLYCSECGKVSGGKKQ